MNGMCTDVNVLSLMSSPTALMSLINAVGDDHESSNGNDDNSGGGGDDDNNYSNNNKT